MERKSKTIRTYICLTELFSSHTPHVSIVNDKKACLKDFEWFAVLYAYGMDGIHGIVGMSTGLTSDSGPILV